MFYPDIMVDVETTGLDSSDNAMIQLAAVKFNLKERSVNADSMFNKCLSIPPRRYWDESTRQWWSEQKRSILMEIYANMEDPRSVMEAFTEWVGPSGSSPLRFWAKPIHFDWGFVASYYKEFGMMNPFHFRVATDMNSYIRGYGRDPDIVDHRTEFKGDAHNALYDVLNQIDSLFQAEDHYANLG